MPSPAFDPRAVFSYFTQAVDGPLLGTADAIMGRGLTEGSVLVLTFGTIAIALYGMSIAAGWSPQPAQGFLKLVAKLAFFSVLVTAGTYSYWVRDAVITALPAFFTALVSVSGAVTATGAAAYDAVLNQAMAAGLTIWEGLSTYNPMKLVIIFVFLPAVLFALLAGYGVWLLGHIMAVLYVAFGPVFLPMALFSTTRSMFSAWVGCTISAVVLQGLSVALTTLLIGTEMAIMGAMMSGGGDTYQRLSLLFAAVAVFLLCGWWAIRLPAAAAALCGGIHFAPNLLVAATYGAVSQGARAAVGRFAGIMAAQGHAAQQRLSAPSSLTPPGPTLSRPQPSTVRP